MLTASIHLLVARIAQEMASLGRARARKRSNAIAVYHLQALPAYLRRDIGLSDDVDIVDVVEHGSDRRSAGPDTRRPIAGLPHAV